MNKLSTRLEMVASLVPNGVNCADIGADHGYLIISLLNRGIIKKGYACENKVGPFNRLKENVQSLGLLDKIEVDLSDGIRTLPSDVNCVIIAGMGGDTVNQIILDSVSKLEHIDHFIISSHSKMDEVRRLLNSKGFYIENEKTCFDMNQYYEVSLFSKGNIDYTEKELKYGPILLKNKDFNLSIKLEEKVKNNLNLMQNKTLPEEKINSLYDENLELSNILKLLK